MAEQWIDLHTHSIASDGFDSPTEIIGKAARLPLRAIALTDHDTVAGLAEGAEAANDAGLQFLPGCEVSVLAAGEELHFLAYYVPRSSPLLDAFLESACRERIERNQAILDRLADRGLPISTDEMTAAAERKYSPVQKRPAASIDIALAMIRKKYVSSVREAFARHIGKNGSAYVARKLPSPEECLSLLTSEGMSVSWAHPFSTRELGVTTLETLLKQFVSLGLCGIEAYHSAHTASETRCCLAWAKRYNLQLTGGSDYHGGFKPGVNLGFVGKNKRIPYSFLENLENYRRQKGLWVL